MLLRANAKINLALDVLRKREDGYHEVRMIMQTVGMYDRVTLTPLPGETGVRMETSLPYLPANEKNLAWKAASLLMEEFHVEDGLHIRLDKFIPVAAGLAGGSSDAAAALVGVNELFSLGLARHELMERGAKIGADVPYCILQGTALAEGIGEKLTSLPPMPKSWILISRPNISVSTKQVYGALAADRIKEHPDVDGMIEAIRARSLAGIASRMGNVLESVTIPDNPVIETLKQEMLRGGAMASLMSGSGPTVFGLFSDRDRAEILRDDLRKRYPGVRTFLTWPVNGGGNRI